MRSYRDLIVYHKAHGVALRADVVCALMSNRRHPGLASQLRRASASVTANIVEGCGHSSRYEFARFLQLALASNVEVDHHLQYALDVRAIDANKQEELVTLNREVRRMTAALLKRVRDELSEAEKTQDQESGKSGSADSTALARSQPRKRAPPRLADVRHNDRPDTA